MVGGDVRCFRDDVEIGHGGFDHDDVCAFLCISSDGSAGEAFGIWRELVAFAVTKRGGTSSCFSEGTIESTGEFGRIGHEGAFITETGVDEGTFYGTDATVHHVRGSNTVSASASIGESNLGETSDGRLGIDGGVGVEDPAVAMGGVFAETDIASDVEGGVEGLYFCDSLDDGALGVVGGRAGGVLFREGGYAEKDDGSETFGDEGVEEALEPVDAPTTLAGEGGDWDCGVGVI